MVVHMDASMEDCTVRADCEDIERELRRVLQSAFGKHEFREGQITAIRVGVCCMLYALEPSAFVLYVRTARAAEFGILSRRLAFLSIVSDLNLARTTGERTNS
eukprot:909131-Pyramimonas_sp.AAC.1